MNLIKEVTLRAARETFHRVETMADFKTVLMERRSEARFQCWGLENGSRVKTLVLPVLGAHLNLQYPHTYWAGVISGASCPARLAVGSSGLNERPSLKI